MKKYSVAGGIINTQDSLRSIKTLISHLPKVNNFLINISNQWRQRQIHKDLLKISNGEQSIIVGPWLSEVGFEVLYWIPFLRWVIKKYALNTDRLSIISRGGAKQWYEGFNKNYFDIFDVMTPDEFKIKNENRIIQNGLQKHISVNILDKEILERLKNKLGVSNYHLLHPSYMYLFFNSCWAKKQSISLITNHTIYKQYEQIHGEELINNLPKKYIAVKFYNNPSFPKNQNNDKFVEDIIRLLAQKNHVLLLNTGLKIDDHDEIKSDFNNISSIEKYINPKNNLAVQTEIIARADAFWGTYGGFSYLPLFFGVPSYSFYSDVSKIVLEHIAVAYEAVQILKSKSKNPHQPKKNEDQSYSFEYNVMDVASFELLNKMI